MGSPLISLHFTALPPLGWAIYHSTRTCKRARAHTGMYKQMPLSAAHHKPECTLHLEGEQQIICCHCSATHALSPGFTADPAHLQRRLARARAHAPFSSVGRVYACIHVSSGQEQAQQRQLWCGSRRRAQKARRQADESGSSAWIIPAPVNRASRRDGTHTTLRGYE